MDQFSPEASHSSLRHHDDGLTSARHDLLSGKTAGPSQFKSLFRTLRYIGQDLYSNSSVHNGDTEAHGAPASWILKTVLETARPGTYRPQYWQADLAKVLGSIKSLIELEVDGVHQFYKEDMSGLLFPTEEGFTLSDLRAFVERVEDHIRAF